AERNDSEYQPPPKRRLSSAVVMVKDGEVTEDVPDAEQDVKEKESMTENTIAFGNEKKPSNLPHRRGGFTRRYGNRRIVRTDSGDGMKEHMPRVLPKDNDPSVVSRNRRMLGSLLGTLEKFQREDKQLSTTEAYMRRSDSLQRAEQRAREESEKLRQQEREKIAENRRRDLTLRARVAAKAEEKKLELLFLDWSEHHKKLGNYLRTKAEPSIYYLPVKPLDEDETVAEQRKEKAFLEWKAARREELTEYQKQIGEQYLANVETELERWHNTRNTRRGNNNMMNLQETMDKELETHQLEHGPKTRKIPGGDRNNDEEDDVEDIDAGEDDIMDDVLVVDDNRGIDDSSNPEAGNASPSPDDM
ncbi:protein-protein interaction regulator family protein, partial [Thalictrum thalictroides]